MASWQQMYGLPGQASVRSSEGPGGFSGRGPFTQGDLQVNTPQNRYTPGPVQRQPFGQMPSDWMSQRPIGTGQQQTMPSLPAPTSPDSGFAFTPQQGTRVNLSGWDSSRTDLDPKQVYGQYAQAWQAAGKPVDANMIRSFVAQDPRWEIAGGTEDNPTFQVKQGELDKWKPGTTVPQYGLNNGQIAYFNDPVAAQRLGFGPQAAGVGNSGASGQMAGLYGQPPQSGVPGSYGDLYGSSFSNGQQQQNPYQTAQPGGLNRWMLPGAGVPGGVQMDPQQQARAQQLLQEAQANNGGRPLMDWQQRQLLEREGLFHPDPNVGYTT